MLNCDMYTERNVLVSAGTAKELIDETLADVTRLHSTQHDVQENTSETNDLRFSKRKRTANLLHTDQEKILETH